MKTTGEFHEDQVDELKKAADASSDAHMEGEIGDKEALGVAGGAPFFGQESVKQPPLTPV